jgi:hypothetical protein
MSSPVSRKARLATNRYYVVPFTLIDGEPLPHGLNEQTTIDQAVETAKAFAFGGTHVGAVIFRSLFDEATGQFGRAKAFVAMGEFLERSDIVRAMRPGR